MRSVRHVEFVDNRVEDENPPDRAAAPASHPAGGLDLLLDDRPAFRSTVRGYDRLEVDNYVAWAETELAAAQREREHLLDRIEAGATELEVARRQLKERPAARPAFSDRVNEILRLAEDQAAQVMAATDAEAARVLADARLEADARLRKAHEIKERAAEVADQLRADAQRDRAQAAAMLAQARAGAELFLQQAAEERERLAAEAVAEREQLTADIADLRRRHDDILGALRGLAVRLGDAMRMVGVSEADEHALAGGPGDSVPA